MAPLVAKHTNAASPIASKPVQRRWVEHVQDIHYRRLAEIRARNVRPNANGNNWGTRNYAGVTDQKQPSYPHLRANLKRAQKEDERFMQIEWENRVLLMKMSSIMAQVPSPFDRTLEFQPGVRLGPNQYPMIDQYVSNEHIAPRRPGSGVIEGRSLNYGLRKSELVKILHENGQIVRRIQAKQPTYSRDKMLAERRRTERYLGLMTEFPERSPYTQQGSRASSRPRPRLQSASLRAHSGSFGSSYERQGEEEATSFQLGLDREARAGAALLALGDTFVDFGQSRLRVGDALCVEPGSDIREYTTVLSISFAAAGAGAAARSVAGVMHVEISPALRFTHPAQTVVRKVERQVAEQLRQRGLLPASPSDDSAGVPSRAQFDAMVEEAVSQETHFTAALDLSALRAEGRG